MVSCTGPLRLQAKVWNLPPALQPTQLFQDLRFGKFYALLLDKPRLGSLIAPLAVARHVNLRRDRRDDMNPII